MRNKTTKTEMEKGTSAIYQKSLGPQAQVVEMQCCVLEDNDTLNNHTYTNRSRNDRWSPFDTELFYEALQKFGTDFNLIARRFPNRDRKQIKNKYIKEWTEHPQAMSAAMLCDFDARQYMEIV